MAQIATEQNTRHGLQPSKGTDYKSAPAESYKHLWELGEAKSAPAFKASTAFSLSPVHRFHAMLLQILIALTEMMVSEKSS